MDHTTEWLPELYKEDDIEHIKGPIHRPRKKVTGTQMAKVSGSIVDLIVIQRILLTGNSCLIERTGQRLLICSTSPSSYNSKLLATTPSIV